MDGWMDGRTDGWIVFFDGGRWGVYEVYDGGFGEAARVLHSLKRPLR